jgi:pimeloyl-ACP methyl ester carboxylesterase
MKLDIVSHQGNRDKPAVVLIHGLGMDKNIWINPSDSRVIAGTFPLTILVNKRVSGEQPEPLHTLFDDLKAKDYGLITWSQKRPAGPMDSVVQELREVTINARGITDSGIILIGHSRGGLIGRKYLLSKDMSVKGLITIATPHRGSSIAKLSQYISPLISLIDPVIPGAGLKGERTFAIRRIVEFLRSRALKELLPESSFFRSLNDEPSEQVYYASVCGTNPTLFNFHGVSFPDIFEKIIPENLYPEEMKRGKGDGLVSARSSMFPWDTEHYQFECNHAEILFDTCVRDRVGDLIDRISY